MSLDAKLSYRSLYKTVESQLNAGQRGLFAKLGNFNFEQVLRALDVTIDTLACYGHATAVYDNDRGAIRKALIKGIQENHVADTYKLDDTHKDACAKFLEPFRRVFTTNYDLLLYWVLLHFDNTGIRPEPLHDGFFGTDPPYSYRFMHRDHGIRYLHGAVHIHMAGGIEVKRVYASKGTTLIDQVKDGIAKGEYPLFVAESSSAKKRQYIRKSKYLEDCYDDLHRNQTTVITYGHSLSDEDDHIRLALARSKASRLCVGVFGAQGSEEEVDAQKSVLEIYRHRLGTSNPALEFIFYDSRTVDPWK
jgi:hypothetical protein